MTLADRGWSDSSTWWNLMRSPRRYGSKFLFVAMGVVALGKYLSINSKSQTWLTDAAGGIISPLQEVVLTTTVRKVPAYPQTGQFTAISDKFPNVVTGDSPPSDQNLAVVLTRAALSSTSLIDIQSRLWQRNSSTCTSAGAPDFSSDEFNLQQSTLEYCLRGGAPLLNLTLLEDPFLCELPANFSTGLVQSCAPRISSAAYYERITPGEFPANCQSRPGAFFVEFGNFSGGAAFQGDGNDWGVSACMPSNQTVSPWINTPAPQHFSEELFMRIAINGVGYEQLNSSQYDSYYKVTVDTEAGYFELPYYGNGQAASFVLEDGDVQARCGLTPAPTPGFSTTKRVAGVEWANASTTIPLETVVNKGPLLTIAMAIFGEGSYLANRVKSPEAYLWQNPTSYSNFTVSFDPNECIDLTPFTPLLPYTNSDNSAFYGSPCIKKETTSIEDLQLEIAGYIFSFLPELSVSAEFDNAWTAAAFLANQAWFIDSAPLTGSKSWEVTFDLGKDAEGPLITPAGLAVVSLLLVLFLLSLLCMAIYSSQNARWTSSLDSFAMMRIGGSMGDKIPLRLSDDDDAIAFLDRTPGWIGDFADADAYVGDLGLGAPTPLKRNKLYWAYEKDQPLRDRSIHLSSLTRRVRRRNPPTETQ